MKTIALLLTLAFAPTLAVAANQCEKSADGDVTCQQVSGESAKDSETTSQPVVDAQQTEDAQQSDEKETTQGGEFGDETTQSRETGIEY